MEKAQFVFQVVFHWRCLITKIILKVLRPPLAIKEDGEEPVHDDTVLDLQTKSRVS